MSVCVMFHIGLKNIPHIGMNHVDVCDKNVYQWKKREVPKCKLKNAMFRKIILSFWARRDLKKQEPHLATCFPLQEAL